MHCTRTRRLLGHKSCTSFFLRHTPIMAPRSRNRGRCSRFTAAAGAGAAGAGGITGRCTPPPPPPPRSRAAPQRRPPAATPAGAAVDAIGPCGKRTPLPPAGGRGVRKMSLYSMRAPARWLAAWRRMSAHARVCVLEQSVACSYGHMTARAVHTLPSYGSMVVSLSLRFTHIHTRTHT